MQTQRLLSIAAYVLIINRKSLSGMITLRTMGLRRRLETSWNLFKHNYKTSPMHLIHSFSVFPVKVQVKKSNASFLMLENSVHSRLGVRPEALHFPGLPKPFILQSSAPETKTNGIMRTLIFFFVSHTNFWETYLKTYLIYIFNNTAISHLDGSFVTKYICWG